MKPLSYHQAIRVLLEGTCGANPQFVGREAGVARVSVVAFLRDGQDANSQQATVDAIGMFVWRRLNAHLLLCDADRISEIGVTE
jgi:hypothetical protein